MAQQVMATTAYDRVTDRLAALTRYRPPNSKGDWLCPAHPDSNPSLSVNPGRDGNVVLHCQANCDLNAVLQALDLTPADLFDAPQSNGKEQPQDIYPYVDEHSNLLFEVVRFPNKKFRQRRPDGKGGWEWSLGDTRRVLFRLPQVIDAARTGRIVFVCEGEKDVLAVERSGGVATCNPHGAGKWRQDYSEALKGADVVIVRDQDPAGTKHAADVESSLSGKAKRVRVVDPHAGKDAFDHLTGGHTLEDWLRLPDDARLQRALVGNLVRDGVPQPAMVHGWLYAGGLHIIQSEPGIGKSWVALWLCVQLTAGGWSVVYMDEEGGRELIAERLSALGADPEILDQRFHYYPFPGRSWSPTDIEALREVIAEAQRSGPIAVGVLDSLPDFLASADLSENDAKEVTSFVHRLLAPFRDAGAALVVLDHLNKPDTNGPRRRSRYSRGSGAKLAKAHLTILLEEEEGFDRYKSGKLNLWATKDRRGFAPLPRLTDPPMKLLVKVGDGTLRIEVSTDAGADWDGPVKCMEAVLHLLKLNPGHRYSPYQLEQKLKAKQQGYRRTTIAGAAEKLAITTEGVRMAAGPHNSTVYWWATPSEIEQGLRL